MSQEYFTYNQFFILPKQTKETLGELAKMERKEWDVVIKKCFEIVQMFKSTVLWLGTLQMQSTFQVQSILETNLPQQVEDL